MKSPWIFVWVLLALGCGSPRITTAWKADHSAAIRYDKIVVVAIIKTNDDTLRAQVEKNIALSLHNLGYKAVSAMGEFGREGLSNLGEVEAYKKLCTDGIDAVMTITLIDASKESRQTYRKKFGYPSNYYYNRIWNYKNMQADVEETENAGSRYFWESILFNLNTLEAECTIQTRSFRDLRLVKMTHDFETQVIQKMIKEKILAMQSPKPF